MSPLFPSFVSLFSLLVIAVLCWAVVLRRVCMLSVHSSLPVCFPLRGSFCSLLYFIIKKTLFLHLSPRLIYPHVPWQNGSAKRGLSRMDFLYSDWEQHLDHPKQTLAWRLCLCQQNGRPLGIYAEGLYDAVQGQGLTKASLNYLCLAGLDKPVNWDLVDHVIAQKELELKMEVSACLSARLAVPEDPRIWSATPRTSCSFVGYPWLRCSVEDPPLMSVRRAAPPGVADEAAAYRSRRLRRNRRKASSTLYGLESAPEPAPFREPTE